MAQPQPKLKKELHLILGDSALPNATVKHWVAEFKIGRISTADQSCS